MVMSADSPTEAPADNSLLLLDDDGPLRNRLGRALDERGFSTTLVETVAEAMAAVRRAPPAFAVLDMRLEDGSGLSVVKALRAQPGDFLTCELRDRLGGGGVAPGRRRELSGQASRRR